METPGFIDARAPGTPEPAPAASAGTLHAVDHLLAGLGTARPSVHRERGPSYERGRPNELWHIDIKGPFLLRRSAREYEKTWIVGLVSASTAPPSLPVASSASPHSNTSTAGSPT